MSAMNELRSAGSDASPRTLADAIAADLRRRILKGELPVHERIDTHRWVRFYGVDRAVVLAAFARLRREGLLRIDVAGDPAIATPDISELRAALALHELVRAHATALRKIGDREPISALHSNLLAIIEDRLDLGRLASRAQHRPTNDVDSCAAQRDAVQR